MAGRTDPPGTSAAKTVEAYPCSLFDLAPSGVYRARPVARPAGELLPRRFTLTGVPKARQAVCFLLHFPWPRGRWELPITASCGARTFLPSGFMGLWRPHCARPAIIRSASNVYYNIT